MPDLDYDPFDLTAARAALAAVRSASKNDALREDTLEACVIILGDLVESVDEAVAPSFPSNRFSSPSRVECVGHGGDPNRPGTLARFERVLIVHERMIVAFDDGETRSINPDVMRTIR